MAVLAMIGTELEKGVVPSDLLSRSDRPTRLVAIP
jgi:hypothetical protein